MKKTFFILIISLISLNLFAEGKITYNKGRVKNGFCRQSAKSKRVRLTFFEIQNLPDNFLVLCGQ